MLRSSGQPGRTVVITSAPGQLATIVGYIELDGSYTTLRYLRIDGSNTLYNTRRSGTTCPYPVSEALGVNGSNDILEDDDIYQSVASLRGNGIGIGFNSPPPQNTIIRYDKIHDVGRCDNYDHLIYLAAGSGTQIYDNWLWNDAYGWGVQLYPAASASLIRGNVIDAAGSGFTFEDERGHSVAENQVFNNVVLDSVGVSNPDLGAFSAPGVLVSSAGLGSASEHNAVFANDSFDNPGGIAEVDSIDPARLAVPPTNDTPGPFPPNLEVDPQFADPNYRQSHDYRLQAGSPLAPWGLWNGNASTGLPPTVRGATGPAVGGSSADAASVSFSAPPHSQPGDVLLAAILYDGVAAQAASLPSGWAAVPAAAQSARPSEQLRVYERIVSTAEPASYSFPVPPGSDGTGGLLDLAGVRSSDPIAGSAGSANLVWSSIDDVVAPSVTPSSPNALLVFLAGITGYSGPVSSPPGMQPSLQVVAGGQAPRSLLVASETWREALATGASVARVPEPVASLADVIAVNPVAPPFP